MLVLDFTVQLPFWSLGKQMPSFFLGFLFFLKLTSGPEPHEPLHLGATLFLHLSRADFESLGEMVSKLHYAPKGVGPQSLVRAGCW